MKEIYSNPILIFSFLTFLISFLTLLFNAKKLLFINTVTKERTLYLEKLRSNLSEFITHIQLDESESVIKKYNYIKLLLNSENRIDQIMINQIEKVFNNYNLKSEETNMEIEKLSNLSQKFLSFEWSGIKNETKIFHSRKKFVKNFYKSLLLFFVLLAPLVCFSQITIGSVEKNISPKIEPKPIPYDSLINYKKQEEPLNYKMYIGLKLFLPPYDKREKSDYTGRVYPFMFKDTVKVYNAISNIPLIKADSYGRETGSNFKNFATVKYKPYYYFSGIMNGNSYTSISTDGEKVSNRYYTVTNVFIKKQKDSIISEISKKLRDFPEDITYVDKDLFVSFDAYDYSDKIFQLQDDISKEKMLVFDLRDFIFVPYFLKQKQLYNSKKLIAIINNGEDFKTTDFTKNEDYSVKNKSVWNTEVTLLSKREIFDKNAKLGLGNYFIAYKLTNDQGTTLIFKGLDGGNIQFINYDEYVKQEELRKLNEEQRNDRIRKEEIARKARILAIEKARKDLLINKFGDELAETILQGNVQIGMTREMCEFAWGKPYDKDITIVKNRTVEYWKYTWKKSLYFDNNILVRIDK